MEIKPEDRLKQPGLEKDFSALVKKYEILVQPAFTDLKVTCQLVAPTLREREQLPKSFQTTVDLCNNGTFPSQHEAEAAFQAVHRNIIKTIRSNFEICYDELVERQWADTSREMQQKAIDRGRVSVNLARRIELREALAKYKKDNEKRLRAVRLQGGSKYWKLHGLLTSVQDEIDQSDYMTAADLRVELAVIDGHLMQREVQIQKSNDEEAAKSANADATALKQKTRLRDQKKLMLELDRPWSEAADELRKRIVELGRIPEARIKRETHQCAYSYTLLKYNVVTIGHSTADDLTEWITDLEDQIDELEQRAYDFCDSLRKQKGEVEDEEVRKAALLKALNDTFNARCENISESIDDLQDDFDFEDEADDLQNRLAAIRKRVLVGEFATVEDLQAELDALERSVLEIKHGGDGDEGGSAPDQTIDYEVEVDFA